MEMMLMAAAPESMIETCRRLCATRHNVLLQGPVGAIDAALAVIAPCLLRPVAWKKAESKFDPGVGAVASLILHEVGSLNKSEQIQLRDWLDNTNARPQIVSTTTHPLFRLVECGTFDATLYYRLNVVLLEVQLDSQLFQAEFLPGRE
jgi:hypothetical protein